MHREANVLREQVARTAVGKLAERPGGSDWTGAPTIERFRYRLRADGCDAFRVI